MATVVDVARDDGIVRPKQSHNTAYQKGNDDPNTPSPTWLTTITFATVAAETHITARNDVVPWVGINNTADSWVPHLSIASLSSTPATDRF